MKKISDDIQVLLKTVFDDCQKEDIAVRERQIRNSRRLKLLWEGFQRVWYSEIAHDWRVWDETQNETSDQSSYDKPINVFKAYLESIIAALSVTIPPIKCFPDDATNTLDLATAKAGDKIGQLIYRHNDVPLLWLHSLFIFATEGMTACYSYPKEDEAYGTYEQKDYEDIEEDHEITTCSLCGHTLNDNVISSGSPSADNPIEPNTNQNQTDTNSMGMVRPQAPQMTSSKPLNMSGSVESEKLENQERDEFQPDDEDAPLHAALNDGQDLCPACMQMMDPQISRNKFIVTRLVGITHLPKTRICLESYGLLNVKVANYAKKQKDTPYLIFSFEKDYGLAVEPYEHLRGKDTLAKKIKSGNQAGSYNQYEQWGRLSPQYQGEYPINVVTINNAWIRPGKFNILKEEEADKLKKLFPDGVKVVFVNDEFASACNESLDDCWTIAENPLSDYITFEALGQGLTSIQEITNDLISLVLQTIEHGIGQTFADPAVLNFKGYAQTEVLPGGIFPGTPKSGKSLSDGFHELRTATLSAEVLPFSNQIQSLAQLTSGALPSLFGGNIQGSETASQYSMSRAQALQRLQNTWKMYTLWWKNIFGKVIPMYIDEMQDDERDVQLDDSGNFVNILIKKAELEGKIGKVELEANENLPMTWSQTKDLVVQLLTNPNEEVKSILMAPENAGLIHDALGLVDFHVPNEDDVIKQNDEIQLLLNSEPLQTGDPQNPEVPSIDIDPIFDNSAVEFEVCRKWIISEAGRQAKTDNQNGYRNVLLHGKAHYTINQQNAAIAQQNAEQIRKVISYGFKGPDLVDPQIREDFDKTTNQPPPPPGMPVATDKPASNGNGANPPKPNPLTTKQVPITENSDVQTIQ